jgi:hypothetical protein
MSDQADKPSGEVVQLRRAGRPPGPTDQTLQLMRECLSLTRTGFTADKIAVMHKVRPSYVRRLVRAGQELEGQSMQTAPGAYRVPRPYSPDTILRRAWPLAEYKHPPARALPDNVKIFWFRALRAVAGAPGGLRLLYDKSSGYLDRSDFCALNFATETDLDLLFRRGLLIELEDDDGDGIALPTSLGLTPGEKALQSRMPDYLIDMLDPSRNGEETSPDGPEGPVHGNTAELHTLHVGRGDRGQTGDRGAQTSTETRYEQGAICTAESGTENDTTITENGPTIGTTIGTNIPGGAPPPAVGVVGKNQRDSTTLDSNNNSGTYPAQAPADGREIDTKTDTTITPNDTDINSKRNGPPGEDEPALTDLVNELIALTPMTRPRSRDRGAVKKWLDAGLTHGAIVEVVKDTLEDSNPATMSTLTYFNNAMRNEITRLAAVPPAAPAAQPPAESSTEDRRIRALIRESAAAKAADSSCPLGPSLATYKAAIERGQEPQGARWIQTTAEWQKAGKPAAYKPPDFSLLATNPDEFERILFAAEEGLTDPPPGAAH